MYKDVNYKSRSSPDKSSKTGQKYEEIKKENTKKLNDKNTKLEK